MGVTVNEIARICGVSRTTVLRALNNQSRVSDRTRRRVLEVAKELGYRPNLLARSLNTGRTMTLGIVAINMDSLIFVQTLSAINTEAQRKGYSLNIALHGQSSEAEMQHIRDFTDRRMEGILLSPISKGPEFEQFLLSLGTPVVCIGNYVSEQISTVMIDEELAARFRSLGLPAVLAINKIDLLEDKTRLAGMMVGIQSRFDPASIIPISVTEQDGVDLVEQLAGAAGLFLWKVRD